jgi:hypothetical protein
LVGAADREVQEANGGIMSINVEANLTQSLPDDWQRDMREALEKLEDAALGYTQAGDAYVAEMKNHTEAKKKYEDAYARAHLGARTKVDVQKPTQGDIEQHCVLETLDQRQALAIAYVMKEAARTARESAEMILKTRQARVDALRGVGFLMMQEMKLSH